MSALLAGTTTVLLMALPAAPTWAQTQTLNVFAAGSLREPMTEAAKAFEAAHPGVQVMLTFAASGLLRERIEGGAAADVFASANMAHPERLSGAGAFGATRRFARNELCGFAAWRAKVSS